MEARTAPGADLAGQTLSPNLRVATPPEGFGDVFVLADIPGLIAGARALGPPGHIGRFKPLHPMRLRGITSEGPSYWR